MEKETIWFWVILVAGLFLAGCGGSPSSLIRDSSAILPGQVIGLPSAASGDADALPSLADWKAFVSKNLQVEISHPPDWSVRERPKGVAFTSPDGRLIQLTLVGTGDLSSEGLIHDDQLPDARCSSGTNTHGVTVRVCFDALAGSRTASFILKPAGGPARIFSLLTDSRSNIRVFDAMIASIRPPAL